jgi:uncharacterized membrane protein required for colicin V production
LAIFLSVASLAGMVGYLLHRVAKGLLMGWLDAIVGLGFGSVKGVMILTVLLFLLAQLPLLIRSDSASHLYRRRIS